MVDALRLRRAALAVGGGLGLLLVLALGVGVGGYLVQNVTYDERTREALAAAGVVERQVEVDGVRLAYAVGPDHGPPIVFVHGQGSRWQDHAAVLTSDLAARAHVFAVDVPGHGGSDRLAPEAYTAVRVGELLADFVAQVSDEPVVLAGHSSGALLVAEIAAERPELVSAVLLEDPPFYSSEMPRAASTTGGALFGLAHDFLVAPGDGDFLRHFVRKGRYFAFFGPFERPIVRYAEWSLERHPGEALDVFFLPPVVNVFFDGLVRYDPAFGAAWYDGRWYEGYDTDAVLEAIRAPTTLVHTTYWVETYGSYEADDGTLMAAMDGDDLERTLVHLDDVELVTVASGHLVHFERPDVYLAALEALLRRAGR